MRTTLARRRRRARGDRAGVARSSPRSRRSPTCARRSRRSCGSTPATRALVLARSRRAARRRLGGSALAQVYGQLGDDAPDLDDPRAARGVLRGDPAAARRGALLAYHDSSDGGLFVDACRDGVRVALRARDRARRHRRRRRWPRCSPRSSAPSCRCARRREARARRRARGRARAPCVVGTPRAPTHAHSRAHGEGVLFDESRVDLHRAWSATTHAMQRLRDNPDAADAGVRRGCCDAATPAMPPRADVRSGRRRRRAVHRDRARGRGSRSCASRASTARSRWRRRSTARASTRSTCT